MLAIEPIIDMGRTATNVTGQALVPLVVAKREGIWDKALWDAAEKGSAAVDKAIVPEPAEIAK